VVTNHNNEIPEGFKMTELGLLPEEWEVLRLGRIAEVKYGKANPKDDGQIPVVGSGGVFSGTSIPLVDYPTIVIGRKGTAGKVWLFLSPCYPSDTTFYLQWKSNIDVTFLFAFMLLNPLSGEHAKTTLPSLQKPYLENMIVPLPPILEQRTIAYVLSTIQRAIEAQDKLIAAARELKKSLMRHLFTYGPVPLSEAEHVPLKETDIGPLPEHWEVVQLENLMKLRTENVLPKNVPDMRYVGLEHMDTGEMKLQRWGTTEEVRSAKSRFYQEDILYGKLRPYLDKAALAEWEGVCSTDILVFTPDRDTALPDYLSGLLHTKRFVEHAISTTSGVNHPRTSWSSIKSFAAPYPPLPEQQEIASILSTVDKKIETEQNRKASLQTLFETMLHQLMTGKVRVKELSLTENMNKIDNNNSSGAYK